METGWEYLKLCQNIGCGFSCLRVMGSVLGLKHSEIETNYAVKLYGKI
jgi:hypothetical protein